MPAAPAWNDDATSLPADWASSPIVGRFDRARAVELHRDEALFTDAVLLRSELGDGVFVLVREHRCGAGGSACQGTTPTFDDVRVGALDDRGLPALAVPYRCTEGRCALEALTLRRTADAKTYVLTNGEAPLLAFTHVARPAPTPAPAPRSTNAAAPLFGIAAFVVVAIAALVARRYRKRAQA